MGNVTVKQLPCPGALFTWILPPWSSINQGYIYAVLLKKENSKINVTIPAKKIGNYFPETYSKEQIEEVIFMLLDKWKQNREGVADAEDTV